MMASRSHRHRGGRDNLFGWTVFLILLAGFAALSWIGSFYIFGHPERPFSYAVLRTLGKIDPPKRFELTRAPRGQFLEADKLLERYGKMPTGKLQEENDRLLRNYLRNYERTKDPVPYVVGDFTVMGAFRLGSKNFFTDGVVALARSKENPSILLELVFPSAEADAGQLERMLRTGLDLKLARTLDLSALVNARLMPDGRLSLTAVPLLYGSYTSTDATGTLSLEPPAALKISAGLPILNQAAVGEAEARYTAYLERTGEPVHSPELMRVQRTEPVKESSIPVARAVAVDRSDAPAAPAIPRDDAPVARALPAGAEAVPVRRAGPARPPEAAAPPTMGDVPVRRAEPVVPLQPFETTGDQTSGE